MFASEHELFSIGTINLPLEPISLIITNTIQNERITNTSYFGVVLKLDVNHKVLLKTVIDQELKVALEDNVYLEIYYHHRVGQIWINKTPTKIKVQEL
jgi:hypothetical protein